MSRLEDLELNWELMKEFSQQRGTEREERQKRINRAREEERYELQCAKEKLEKEREYRRAYEEMRREVEDADLFASMVGRTALTQHTAPPQQGPLDFSKPKK